MRGMYQPCLLTSREDVDIHGLPWSAQVGLMTIGAPDYSGCRTEDTVSCFKVNTWVTWLTWHCILCKVEMAWFDYLQFDEIMETQCFMGGKTMLYHVIRCYKCPNFWAGCSCRNLHHGHLRILDLIVYSVKNRGSPLDLGISTIVYWNVSLNKFTSTCFAPLKALKPQLNVILKPMMHHVLWSNLSFWLGSPPKLSILSSDVHEIN